jgi:hypothetical protein
MAAIYMWVDDEELITLTTTLYPVDVTETIVFGASATTSSMKEIQQDYYTQGNFSVQDGSYTQLRWFYYDGPYYDAYTHGNFDVLDGTYIQLRWFLTDGPYYDAYTQGNFSVQDGTLINKLVVADSPDEEIQMSASAAPSTMELV